MQNAIEATVTKAEPSDWGAMVGLVIREYNAGNFNEETASKLQREAISGGFAAAAERNTVNSDVFSMIEELAARGMRQNSERTLKVLETARFAALTQHGYVASMPRASYETVPEWAAAIAGALYQCGADDTTVNLANQLTKIGYWR